MDCANQCFLRTEPSEDAKPVALQQTMEIPRKPKKPSQPSQEDELATNGNGATGKRKRDGEDEDVEMTNGHVSKKIASDAVSNGNGHGAGDGDQPILLDEAEDAGSGGAILIDD